MSTKIFTDKMQPTMKSEQPNRVVAQGHQETTNPNVMSGVQELTKPQTIIYN